MINSGAEVVDIGSLVRLPLPAVLFRGRVSLRTQRARVLRRTALVLPCDPEVDQHYPAVGTQHDVPRLHVPVYDRRILRVQVFQDVAELQGPADNLRLRLAALAVQLFLQGHSLDVIHDDQVAVIPFDHIDDLRQVWTAELLQDAGLCDRILLDALSVMLSFLPDFFYRPLFSCRLVDRQVYTAHPAVPDLVQDPIFVVYDLAYFQHVCPSGCFHARSKNCLTCGLRYLLNPVPIYISKIFSENVHFPGVFETKKRNAACVGVHSFFVFNILFWQVLLFCLLLRSNKQRHFLYIDCQIPTSSEV